LDCRTELSHVAPAGIVPSGWAWRRVATVTRYVGGMSSQFSAHDLCCGVREWVVPARGVTPGGQGADLVEWPKILGPGQQGLLVCPPRDLQGVGRLQSWNPAGLP
jgi:hypothetical protein